MPVKKFLFMSLVLLNIGASLALCPAIRPEGMLACEDFEDSTWEDSMLSAFNPDNVQISSAKALGYRSARMYGGYLGAAFDFRINATEGSEFYVIYQQHFPSEGWNWSDISATGLKQIRFGARQGDGWPIQTFKGENYDGNPAARTHGYFSQAIDPPHPPAIPAWRQLGAFPSLDSWHEVEVHVRYSSTDGGYFWKIDGSLVGGSETFSHDVWPPPTAYYGSGMVDYMRICGGNGFPDGNYYYVDDIEIWDRPPITSNCTGNEDCDHQDNYSACHHTADADMDGVISLSELLSLISFWHDDLTGFAELMAGIRLWKEGC
jgi:hypothetical protein